MTRTKSTQECGLHKGGAILYERSAWEEMRRVPCDDLRKEHSRRREWQVQRPWGRIGLCLFEQHPGGQHGSSRVIKGEKSGS